jgi:glycosyltransferase involved in cell wall biosynthesis
VGGRRDLEEIYPALDIVALTSRNEGTPLTLIEAMFNARPVISTSVGGVTDLLGESNSEDPDASFVLCPRGISVRSHDPLAFAAGLAQLVDAPQLRREIGERGLEFVTGHYSKERLLTDVRTLYADLLKEK